MTKLIKLFTTNPKIRYLCKCLKNWFKPISGLNNSVVKEGCLIKCKIHIIGNNNHISIAKGCVLKNVFFHIHGNDNTIRIENNCKIYMNGAFWIDGNNNKIIIGKETTVQSAQFCAQELNTQIIVGEKCMISNNVEIRTSDSHPIFEIQSGKRINPSKSVFIGNNVWIAAKATLLKGVSIGDGSVIGYGSIITKNVASHSIAAGNPAMTLKSDIKWEHNFRSLSK